MCNNSNNNHVNIIMKYSCKTIRWNIIEQKKEEFIKQLKSIDYEQAQQLYQHVYVERQAVQGQANLEFAPVSNITTHEDLKVHAKEFEDIGFQAIAKG